MIKLYTWTTGNGLRAAVALAESGLEYEVHKVDLSKGEQKSPEFAKINPTGAIPAIVDTDGPEGAGQDRLVRRALGPLPPRRGDRRSAAWKI